MGRYASDELFHLVGRQSPLDDEKNYQTLKTILRNRCVSHPPHVPDWGKTSYTINWDKTLLSADLFIPTVVCFCDIPFEHLGIHVGKYGKFGLSLPKSLLIRYGARPVIYIPYDPSDWFSHGRATLRNIESVFRGYWSELFDKLDHSQTHSREMGHIPKTSEEAVRALNSILGLDFISFIKPVDQRLSEDDKNNFYMEREWRKYGNQKFEPQDVISIVVARRFESRISEEMPEYATRIKIVPEA